MGPTIDYFRYVTMGAYRNIGIKTTIDVLKRGYYPKGGGIVTAEISPCQRPSTVDLLNVRKWNLKLLVYVVNYLKMLQNARFHHLF